MNTALWIIQILLGTMMLLLGFMKTFLSAERLNGFSWTARSSVGYIRFVGVSELLIGLGLVLPQLTGILPILTSLAAGALCIIMVLAIVEHVRYKETRQIGTNVIIMLLAAFVAVERFVQLQS